MVRRRTDPWTRCPEEGPQAHSASRLQEGELSEGTGTVRARHGKARRYAAIAAATVMSAGVAVGATVTGASASPATADSAAGPAAGSASSWYYPNRTATPIKHVVVIFQENISFDHYFGTYPYAPNTDGNSFHAKRGTPRVNGLYSKITKSGPIGPLLTANPNLYNPQRLTPCTSRHLRPGSRLHAGAEMRSTAALMDKFVQYTESAPSLRRRARTCSSGPDWSWTTSTATRSPDCGITRRTTR